MGNKILDSIFQGLNDFDLVKKSVVILDKLIANDLNWVNEGMLLELCILNTLKGRFRGHFRTSISSWKRSISLKSSLSASLRF